MNLSYKDVILDTHTHSLVSGHAYNTIDEMINYINHMNRNDLRGSNVLKYKCNLLSITEHGPNMMGGCDEYYFANTKVIKNYYNNLLFQENNTSSDCKVLFGCESNILNEKGNIDIISDFAKEEIDVLIASIHDCCYLDNNSIVKNTNAIINTMKSQKVNIIGHPDDRDFDYKEIVLAAKEYQVALEINNSSNNPNGFRKNAKSRNLLMLEYCKEYQVPITLGSDAHCKFDIMNFKYIIPILNEIQFPKELILNTSVNKFIDFCKINVY